MKATSGLVMIVFLGLVSCFNPPEYPNTPEIEYSGATFVDVPEGTVDKLGFAIPDSLLVVVKFKDGDGDIGATDDPDDNGGKYAERYYFNLKDGKRYYLASTGSAIQIASSADFIKYKTKRTNSSYDTLPEFIKPYNCINWQIVEQPAVGTTPAKTIDTVYFQLNSNHYNIFVDFLKLKNDGSGDFEEYDFRKELCTTYDGRIPILAKEQGSDTPLQGSINYWMKGSGFKLVFSNTPMKLRIQIQDRALNKSNIIVSEPFTLSSITK